MAKNSLKKLTGVAVPLGALYSKENQVIGCYTDLIPFSKICKNAGLKLIQLLPVNDTGTQSSPYSGLSAFALHPIYIRIKEISFFQNLYQKDKNFTQAYDSFVQNNKYILRYDYDSILNTKIALLKMIYEQTPVGTTGSPDEALTKFIKANPWIKTYSVYKNLKWKYMQAGWKNWAKEDQHKSPEEIEKLWNQQSLKKDHLFYAWCQQIAAEQFSRAVKSVHEDGILLKGDMPILMNEDSCDTWAHPEFFNQNLRAGSPSDGENPTGQNWGFPTYNWKNLREADYSWWKNRLKSASQYYDAYRLDHILGFFRIWAIPEEDCNALNGHTEPYAAFKKDDLYKLGFDDDRIRWLSQPHIPTSAVEDITWNHEIAHKILETMCDRIGTEELWLFKKTITGSQQLWNLNLKDFVDEPAENRIKAKLVEYWSNRTLLEITKNKFIPLWTYNQSTSWASLNDTEHKNLLDLFNALNKKNEKLWKKQADEIFTAITTDIKMIPCGEDLGVSINCVPKTMKEHNILGLRVVRWSRKWQEENQPYVDFEDYEPLSVTTTSVHDSSTIREWYEETRNKELGMINGENIEWNTLEKSVHWNNFSNVNDSKSLASAANASSTTPSSGDTPQRPGFSSSVAYIILKNCSHSASVWYIPPLQDYLYMNEKYWLPTAAEERINVPGTVTKFNWTYRMPVSLEDLSTDNELIEKIKNISKRR